MFFLNFGHSQSSRRMWHFDLAQLDFRSLIASSISKVSITVVVVQSRLCILGIHATAHRLFSTSILIVPPAVLRSLIHGHHFSPCYLMALSLSLSTLFNRAYTYSPSSCCLTYLDTPPLSCTKSSIHVGHVTLAKNPLCCHLSLSSYPLALILSLFTHILVVVLYIHVTNHSIPASQELGP